MSSGISSYKCLKEVYNKFNELPHSKGKDYRGNEMEGQTSQTVEIRNLGYEIYDIREEYRLDFWALDDVNPPNITSSGRINKHFWWNEKELFLPAKKYFKELYVWTERVSPEFLRVECDYNSKKYHDY